MLVDGKTNEITALPKLLRQIDVKGATVTLDAIGCQKKIAREIHFAGAHHLLALKATDTSTGSSPAEPKHWLGLRSLVENTSTRQLKGQTSTEKRYYLSSHAPDAELSGRLARRPWASKTAATGSWT